MTKQEALNKIKELEQYVNEMDNKVRFEDDEIFLLSIEEYEKYKDRIPHVVCWWWLRSPGYHNGYAANVYYGGSVRHSGDLISIASGCVRPALRIPNLSSYTHCPAGSYYQKYRIGDRIVKYDFPWIIIDEDLVIAEVPIAFHRFDAKSNDYATSEVRQLLKDWKEERS